jgi:ABC-2 type transport system permease protein
MSIFQARELMRNQFFILTLVTATSSAYILLYSGNDNSSPLLLKEISIQSSMFGTWSLGVTATGLIGYQRFQGTLIHLFNSKYKPIWALSTLLISATVMGLVTFPITLIVSSFLEPNLHRLLTANDFLLWFMFILAAAVTSSLLATLFLATPHAIIYEGVLAFPIIYLSGIFTSNTDQFRILSLASSCLPMYYPVQAMLEPSHLEGKFFPWIIFFILISTLWVFLLYFFLERVLVRSALNGKMDIE